MKPILYPDTEMAFSTNGIGVLSDAASCYVETELNGIYELEMQYPVKGIHFHEIGQRSIILAKPDPFSRTQPFRVYRTTKPMGGLVKVYARHNTYDLMGIPVAPFAAHSAAAALQGLRENAVTSCPFTFSTDKTTQAAMTVSVPTAIWSQLGGIEGSVLDVYGGEYEFDRWDVILHNKRGENRGVSIRYGKNLTSLEQDENCANCYTGVYPYWVSPEGELVQLEEKVVNAEGDFGYEKILPLDFSQEWEEAPTGEQLHARAQRYIRENEIGVPTVSWEVGFVQLEQTEEYKGKAILEQVRLGDTVSVVFAEMGVDTSARAVKTRYDVLLDRYESVTLGSVKANIADTVVKNTASAEDNSKKIYIETTQRKDDVKKLNAELTVQSDRIEAEVVERRSDIERMEANFVVQSKEIAAKVSQTGGTPGSFEWSMLVSGWTAKANGTDVFKLSAAGAEVFGKITAWDGKIGCLDIGENYLSSNGMTWDGNQSSGIYSGPEGWKVGAGFKVDIYGNVYAKDGTFEGNIYAKNIQYGGDYGTLSGAGITSRTVTGSTIAYSTISTGNTSSGINTSLSYADYANDVFNGVSTASWIITKRMTLGNYSAAWTTINYVDHDGNKKSIRVMTGQ